MSGSARALVLAAAAACSTPLFAQSSPPVVDAALRGRFGFVGPTIHKVGDGINLLRAVDLDGDGDAEIVVNHGQRGRLAVLDRQEHGSVEEEFVDTEGTINGFETADVDGDGTEDFVFLDRRGRLVFGLRGDGAARMRDIEVGAAATTDSLRLGDVDGDGAVDAAVLLREGVRIVTDLRGEPRVTPTIPLDFDRALAFLLTDVDGDGALDLTLVTTRPEMPIHVKRGDGSGGFGPWLLFRAPSVRRAFVGPGVAGAPTLVVLQDQRGRVVEYALRRGTSEAEVAPQLTSVQEVKRGAMPFAHGDVDGDGDADLVLAHPERAELLFFLEDRGKFDVRTVPSFAGISSVALGDLDADGALDVVVASSEEQALGWKSGAAPLDAFPTRLPVPEGDEVRPLAVAVDAGGSVLVLVKDKKRQGSLHRIAVGDEAPAELGDLGRLSADPSRLLLADVDDRAGDELVVVVPGDGLRVLDLESGSFDTAGGESKAGFTKAVDDGALSLVGTDGKTSLMIVRERFARVFRIDDRGEVRVERQLNGPTDSAELALGAVFGDGRVVLFDRKTNELSVRRGDAAATSYDVPPLRYTHLVEHEGAALLIGRSGVVRVPFDRTWELFRLRDHEPPTEDTNYWTGLTADLDGDRQSDIALLDEDINGVQILVAEADGLRRAVGWPVFEIPEKYDTVYEPREIAAGDWNGDGRADLLLVSHDRVLIYCQEN